MERRGAWVATLGGGALALMVMVGRWSPARLLGRSDWTVLPPRVWSVIALLFTAMLCYIVPVAREPWTREDKSHLTWTSAFLVYMMVAASWSKAGSYAGEKAALLGLILLAVVFSSKLAHDTSTWLVRAFWMWLSVATTTYAAYTARSGWYLVRRPGVQRLTTPLGGGPNVFARATGLLTLAGIGYGTRGARWAVWYAPAALSIVLTLATGSRGGLLALIFGLLAMAEGRGLLRRRGMLPATILVGFLVLGLSVTQYWDRAMAVFEQRVLVMTFEQRDDSGRTAVYRESWELGLSAPVFGTGLGGYHAQNPFMNYPHNLFLEAFSEGGLIGVGLVVAVLFAGARSLAPHRHSDLGTVTWAAWVSLVAASQFSGDLYDSRLAFLLPALAPSLRAMQEE